MTFAEFCDSVENTEKERQFFDCFKTEEMQEVKEALGKVKGAPVVGKLVTAIAAMYDYESLAEFKQTEHYQRIKDWNFSFDPDKGDFSLSPSGAQMKKFLAIIAVALAAVWLCKKICRRRKRAK